MKTSKKEIFINLLKSYGVSEYWCNPFFDPSKEHPNAEILIPNTNAALGERIADLYNDYSDDNKSLLIVSQADLNDELFQLRIKGMEKRSVI